MSGRDTQQSHRGATPLELLFDLTFVVGFSVASSQLAHAVAEGHYAAGLAGFAFAMFCICWAWINYSWFSSAYDTDDWAFRLATFVEMIGVVVLTLGIPKAFSSIEHGTHLEIGVIVLGYIIMRLALVGLWLRAAAQDPARRKTCLTYALFILVAQLGWIALWFTTPGWSATAIAAGVLLAIELIGPWVAETWTGEGGTPWHAHHIAERYGLLAIIGLGEGVIGTVASVSAIVDHHGWSLDAIMICAAGVGLTFALWWIYFLVPAGTVLHAHRGRAFLWGYLHIPVFAAIAATGAGLHVVGYVLEQKAKIGAGAAFASAAIPVAVFFVGIYALYWTLLRRIDRVHLTLLAVATGVLAVAIGLAMAGVSLTICLALLTIAPLVIVIGYEMFGVHHVRRALSDNVAHASAPAPEHSDGGAAH